MEASRSGYSLDLQLAQDVGAGVLDAWHEFVTRYSALIYSIVRRYLADFDAEVRRNAYVEILGYMYGTGLAKYDGRAALSTWIMAIARSRSLDVRRELCGRRRDPVWLEELPERDREIFHFYYENGEDLARIRERFARHGKTLTASELAASLDRLEARMDRRLRTRLAYDLHARSVGAASGSLLGFLDHLRVEHAQASEALRPDIQMMEEQARQLSEQIHSCVEKLAGEERQVVELHYYRHLTAPQIAVEMGLPGARRAYTLIDRALVSLRAMLEPSPKPPAGMQASHHGRTDTHGAEGILD